MDHILKNGINSEMAEAIVETLQEPMIVLDGELRVSFASRSFYKIFEVKKSETEGKLFYKLGNNQWDIPALRSLLEQIIPENTSIEGYEVSHDFEKLGKKVMLINGREIKFDKQQRNILLSITDVTDQRNMQKEREKLMIQKDTLLKEMRHRIANSLQLIASIITLKADSVKSAESKAHLEDAHDRIISIATVQRNLDPSSEGSLVPVADYLTILCQSLTKSMIGGRKPITIVVSGSDGTVVPDVAVSLGLITTELVMNSLKHAFPTGKGQITVTYESKDENWKLSVGDDGVGLMATLAKSNNINREGLGTNIVESLATQLNAVVNRNSTSRGTVVSITHSNTIT
jgi:chemotaxis protein methyltransferase CheR